MYSACVSTKMLVSKLAQMGNFCLAKSDVIWPKWHTHTDEYGQVSRCHKFINDVVLQNGHTVEIT